MNYYDEVFPKIFQPTKVQVNKENGQAVDCFCLTDNRGYIYTKAEVQELFERIEKFYSFSDVDEMAKKSNERRRMDETLSIYGSTRDMELNEHGKYKIPPAVYKFKKFNPDKRNWSCKCGWCDKKISSKVDTGYFTLNDYVFELHFERACSEACAELIWKDGVKNWVHDNGFGEYFEL